MTGTVAPPAPRRSAEPESATRARPQTVTRTPLLQPLEPRAPSRELPPTTRDRLEAAFAAAPEPHQAPDGAEGEIAELAEEHTAEAPAVSETPAAMPVEMAEPALPLPTRERIVQRGLAAAAAAPEPAAPETPKAVPTARAEPPAPIPELGLELEAEESAALATGADIAKQQLATRTVPERRDVDTPVLPVVPSVGPENLTPLAAELAPLESAPETDAPVRTVEAVARGPPIALLHAPIFQTKLSVSQPGDALEREADAVSARVVRGGTPSPRSCGAPAGRLQRALPPARGPPPAAGHALPRTVASVLAAPGGGSPLDAAVRERIEPQLGADLAHVRVRHDPAAAVAARDLHARAFTSGSTIFLAAESSPADLGLMAHEATHVAQQQTVAAARTTLMRDVTDYLPDVSVDDLVPDWILDGVRDAVRSIPGYTLLTYITGRDPLTDEPVTVSQEELIETLLTYGPFGAAVGTVLQAIDVLGDIFSFVSESLDANDLTFARIKRDIDSAWEELSVTNGIAGNVAIVERYVDAFLRDVGSFVDSIVDRVLEIVRSVVAEVAEPLLETPEIAPIWNLTKKVLHYDPLRGVEVEAPTVEIIADFLRLIGEDQRLAQMEERGTLQETADWLDTQLVVFSSLIIELGMLFSDAWAAIQPQNLPDLLTNLESLAQRAFGFVQRVGEFVATLILKILELIKNALLAWLSEHAHTIPGFHLLTVILERNPFTDEVVPRTAENLIKGFITLMPGGEQTYEQLAESGVITDAADRIESAMTRLGISWELVTSTFLGIWDTLSLDDLLDPIGAFERILAQFGEPLARIVEFVGVVIEVVITLILRLMNFPSDLLGSIIANALQAIEDIQRDPIGFLINMLEAVKLGFMGFFDNILTYLMQGLVDWLFRGLRQLGITIPTDLSLASVLNLVLEVLGITVELLWQKLGEHIGPERVEQIRGAIGMLSGAWSFIRDVQEGGVGAVWRYVTDQLGALWDTLLGMARDWIVETVVRNVTARLISMLDPTGVMAVVNSFIAFFNAVQSAIEYLREILEIINQYVETFAQIAAGNVVPGAQKLERGLANAIPIAIGFLANQVGLGNVPEKIVEIIQQLRGLVDQALDWLFEQAIRLGQAALSALGIGGEDEDRPDTPETRKEAALEEISGAMEQGIRRSALVVLLADLRTRLELDRCELVGEASVVVENSDPETVEGVLSFSPEELARQTTGETFGLPGGTGGGDIVVGEHETQVSSNLLTIRGVLAEHMDDATWPDPHGTMPQRASRPERVKAKLTGRLDIAARRVVREAETQRMVGHMGDFERAFHRSNWSSGTFFQGGHIIGHQFGGLESFENLVPMQRELNLSLYSDVEQFIDSVLPRVPVGTATGELPTAMEWEFTFGYGSVQAETVSRLVNIVGSKFGGDVAARDRLVASVHGPSFRQRVSFPARVPTQIVMNVTLLSGPPPASAAVPGEPAGTTETAMTGTMAATRVLDPFILRRPSGGQPQPRERPSGPAEQDWTRRWTFTQTNS